MASAISHRLRRWSTTEAVAVLLATVLVSVSAAEESPATHRERLHQLIYCSGLFTGLAEEAERRGLDGRAEERAATALRGAWRRPVQTGAYDIETAQYAFSMGRNAVVELTGRAESDELDTLVDNCRGLAAGIPAYRQAMETEGGDDDKPQPAAKTAGTPERPIVEREGDQVFLNLDGKVDVDRAAKELQEKIDTMPPTPVGP